MIAQDDQGHRRQTGAPGVCEMATLRGDVTLGYCCGKEDGIGIRHAELIRMAEAGKAAWRQSNKR
ncbi:hypothetical protein [Notoacmeibacter marinus]|uniref:hypothetical protein n=1 Tax=Notoacmeibacter marinus TaxID=1876515 RepID=UPI0011209192|nr:hypothetical protein [Notoacmeibacter marinus]